MKYFVVLCAVAVNLGLLVVCIRTNTFGGPTLDEARYIPAGIAHWREGEFASANDSPPLARMAAVLPLLPMEVKLEGHRLNAENADPGANVKEREFAYGGRFLASNTADWFKFFCLARMVGFLWWVLGAWVVFRWAGRLHGEHAACLGALLWCFSPNVLAWEQQAAPDLPFAVTCLVATHAFLSYLAAPSWWGALVVGVLLGIAQLVEFDSLVLLVLWPSLALLRRVARKTGPAPDVKIRARLLQVAAAALICLWVVNLGYEFQGSGARLGSLNRFQNTWLGRLVVPLPEDYLKGVDRRLHESESTPENDVDPSSKAMNRTIAAAAGRIPVGLGAMMALSLAATIRRHSNKVDWIDELIPWGVVMVVLATAAPFSPFKMLPPAKGILLALPFGILIASKAARFASPERGMIGRIAVLVVLLGLGDMVVRVWHCQFTPRNTARLRLDLDRQLRRAGLLDPAENPPANTVDVAGRGLMYRAFTDSRGRTSNYALFVPDSYHGDRPYPLILFLHGWGDRGTTGRQFTWVGLPFTLEYREIDFIVLCPQSQSGHWDADGDDALAAMEMVAAVQKTYSIDVKRVYLTGLSTGGTGVWNLAARHPDRWAAIAPVASAASDAALAPLVKHIPCWSFHNHFDGGSPAAEARRMFESLKAAGGAPQYTEFFDVGHNAWDGAYGGDRLYQWLARQKLP